MAGPVNRPAFTKPVQRDLQKNGRHRSGEKPFHWLRSRDNLKFSIANGPEDEGFRPLPREMAVPVSPFFNFAHCVVVCHDGRVCTYIAVLADEAVSQPLPARRCDRKDYAKALEVLPGPCTTDRCAQSRKYLRIWQPFVVRRGLFTPLLLSAFAITLSAPTISSPESSRGEKVLLRHNCEI